MLVKAISSLGSICISYVNQLGSFLIFLQLSAKEFGRSPVRFNRILQQFETIAIKSLGIILLTGIFVGITFGLQVGSIFSIFGAQSLIGSSTGLALTLELAPLTTAFLVAGFFGSSTTAELATMKVGEQLDAMEAMGVNLHNYFVKPTVIATVLALPMLYVFFLVLGLLGAYLAAVEMFDVAYNNFYFWINRYLWVEDVMKGLVKSTVFGLVVASIACRYGLTAKGGARGIGEATTKSVVANLLAILAADVVITYFQLRRSGL